MQVLVRETLMAIVMMMACAALVWYIPFHRLKEITTHEPIELMTAYAPALEEERVEEEDDPEVVKRLRELWEASEEDPRTVWANLIEAGLLYKRGQFPFIKPDPVAADACLRTVALWSVEKPLALEARSKLFEDTISDIDINPSAPGPPKEIADEMIKLALRHRRQSSNILEQRTLNTPPPFETLPPPTTTVRSDRQNVHDHGVMASLKQLVERFPPPASPHPQEALREDVERCILDHTLDIGDEDRAKALACLQSLNCDAPHSLLQVTEMDSLSRVWHTIDGDSHAREMLVKQLASGIEHGVPVCSTGKIARILGTMDGVDPDVRIRPLWAVKEEIASLASKTRNDVLARASPSERESYENGTDGEHLADTMRTALEETVHHDYVEKLGMKRDVLQPIVASMTDAF